MQRGWLACLVSLPLTPTVLPSEASFLKATTCKMTETNTLLGNTEKEKEISRKQRNESTAKFLPSHINKTTPPVGPSKFRVPTNPVPWTIIRSDVTPSPLPPSPLSLSQHPYLLSHTGSGIRRVSSLARAAATAALARVVLLVPATAAAAAAAARG